jgi:ABC-type bacteriocin/lantibiotic exporter with double-glycine peptidase domain
MDQAGWASDFDHGILNIDDVELQTLKRPHALTLQPTVALSAVTVSNVPENRPILKNISLTARRSQILAITGPVGSGKTVLLQVLLGELRATSGTVATRARHMAFCAQTTWLQSGSLREQILFGEVFHEEWYAEVIRACALVDDIDWLPLGDATEVGGKGDKLSGGQKQRVVSHVLLSGSSTLNTPGHRTSCVLKGTRHGL